MTNGEPEHGVDARITYRVYVSGRVQGVGYRNFTRRAAKKLLVDGWVGNEPDGSVSAVLQSADPSGLELLLKRMRQGPPGSCVDALLKKELANAERFEGFTVRR